ncbi:PqqD family protein [Raineyella sp. LH-20]|uniref:PqqD family protein n=1 Tax=Raineyella sp. LH-20 TaxID=3081204 RepID=UPI002952CE80|nr:PqqD family protein [Raineyella sp. LH-20]WOP17197.1 PqqD family protein [Raineyella sp. LH-20]
MTTTQPRRVTRVEPVDRLELDDGVLLLYDRTVIRLTDLGRAVVEMCEQPLTEAEIAERLAAEFGEPPEGGLLEATHRLVEDLLSGDVLRRAEGRR